MKKPVDLHFLYLVALASCLLAISLQAATKEAPATKTEDRSRADLASQKQPDSAEPVRFPSTYVEFYRQVLEDYRKGFTAWPGGKPRRLAPGFIDKTSLAEAAYLLWKKTGDPACKAEALDYFAKSLSDPKFDLKSFGQLHNFGELAAGMKEDGLLTPEQCQKVSEIARATLAEFLKQPDDTKPLPLPAKLTPNSPIAPPAPPMFNIRMGQMAGYAGLLRYLKDEPFEQREEVSKRLNAYFDLLCRIGNTEEDAANYDSLGASFAVDLARLLGRENDFKNPAFKRFFEGFRDIVSPSGIIPEYGDSYFFYDDLQMDRVYLMEFAARLYNDASFAEACRKMRTRPLKALPTAQEWARCLNLIRFGEPYPADGKNEGALSHIQMHNVSRDGKTVETVPGKLILRTGNNPGDAMILMDLYATGQRAHIHHAHREKGPSIGYYESAQVPLFHNLGRRGTESAIDGNICWALEPQERFPGQWHPDEWFAMSIPVDSLPTNADGKLVISGMSIRNFSGSADNKGCTSLKFDNLRLEGPAGTCLIDGFESGEEWFFFNNQPTTPPRKSTDKTEGEASQELVWKDVKTDMLFRRLPKIFHPEPFNRQQYDRLKLDVKYSGTRPYFAIRGLTEIGFEMGTRFLRPELKDAGVEQRGTDAFGNILYNRYVTGDSTLSRRIVLTKEGYLVIRDSLLPGATMNGWNGGQLWQLYTLAAHGDHWFCSDDDGVYPDVTGKPDASPQRRMFVRFATVNGATGFEKVARTITYPNPKGLPPTSYVTTFSTKKVETGHRAVFGMAVLPVKPGVAPETLARIVSVTTAPDGTVQAVVQNASQPIVIRIGDNDWSVSRQSGSAKTQGDENYLKRK